MDEVLPVHRSLDLHGVTLIEDEQDSKLGFNSAALWWVKKGQDFFQYDELLPPQEK